MLVTNLSILVLAGFVGYAVISKVPNTLHTPLMSGTNAIHGIVLLGGLLIVGLSGNGAFNKAILVIAITFGTINIVGGFLVTDRMLEMFKSKPKPSGGEGEGAAKPAAPTPAQGTATHAGDSDAPTQQMDVEGGDGAQAGGDGAA